jgi:transposase-like protein
MMANIAVMKCPVCSNEMATVAYEQRGGNELVSYIMDDGDWLHGKVQRYVCKTCLCIQMFLTR